MPANALRSKRRGDIPVGQESSPRLPSPRHRQIEEKAQKSDAKASQQSNSAQRKASLQYRPPAKRSHTHRSYHRATANTPFGALTKSSPCSTWIRHSGHSTPSDPGGKLGTDLGWIRRNEQASNALFVRTRVTDNFALPQKEPLVGRLPAQVNDSYCPAHNGFGPASIPVTIHLRSFALVIDWSLQLERHTGQGNPWIPAGPTSYP